MTATNTMKATTALARIKRHFPQVTTVRDATETVNVTVIPADARGARRKDPAGCALARACVRTHLADACIIGIGVSYLIKGHVATRYITSGSVGRELVSFDRHAEFESGSGYKLSKVSPSNVLGREQVLPRVENGTHPHAGSRQRHHTANVRVIK